MNVAFGVLDSASLFDPLGRLLGAMASLQLARFCLSFPLRLVHLFGSKVLA
jgi:hypothetical protein